MINRISPWSSLNFQSNPSDVRGGLLGEGAVLGNKWLENWLLNRGAESLIDNRNLIPDQPESLKGAVGLFDSLGKKRKPFFQQEQFGDDSSGDQGQPSSFGRGVTSIHDPDAIFSELGTVPDELSFMTQAQANEMSKERAAKTLASFVASPVASIIGNTKWGSQLFDDAINYGTGLFSQDGDIDPQGFVNKSNDGFLIDGTRFDSDDDYEDYMSSPEIDSIDLGGTNTGIDAQGQATGQDEGEGEDNIGDGYDSSGMTGETGYSAGDDAWW